MKLVTRFAFFGLFSVFAQGHLELSEAQDLWRSQMMKVEEAIDEFNLPKIEPNQNAQRQIGTTFFDINFVDTPTDGLNVHSLRPQDVDVVAAMGDSITAAFGAESESLAGIAVEYRSMCFSVGGNATLEESITLPNILKKFNPRLVGYSYENGPKIDTYPFGFNVAVGGARARNMFGQAGTLIDRLENDDRSKFESDWKVTTLFIGGNDLCAIGRDPEGTTPEVYVAEIKRALDLLHQRVPRMLVQIVDILEIYLLPDVSDGFGATPQCKEAQNNFCGYVVSTASDQKEQERLIAINKEYQVQLQALIDSGRYDTRDDFTVVIQPFLRDSVLPYTDDGQVDATYFAPDCFHFSDIGHAMSAVNLWNNMLEHVGEKSTVWEITDLKVPTSDHPFIFTSKNSLPPTPFPPPENNPDPNDSGTEAWLICVIVVLAVCVVIEGVVLFVVRKRRRKDSAIH